MWIQSQTEFAGTARFRVLRRLGAGGFGVVYEALDRERGMRTALKTLPTFTPSGLLSLKHEFRALADLSHPNLVALYELFADEANAFFTMERIDGEDLVSALRGSMRAGARLDERAVAGVRDAFAQLAQGVNALHAAQKLHRDLKPSNVLRERGGRVVLLDFGLVRDRSDARTRDDAVFHGTPDYAAPERLAGAASSEAADWYAVGAMLFETLTGTRASLALTAAAANRPTIDAVDELGALCTALLARDPAQRPAGRAVLATLRGEAAWDGRASTPPDSTHEDEELVGRDREIAWLRSVASRVRPGHAVVAEVYGPSGCGKSALLRAFAREWDQRPGALVLDGRCYERESVPFKGLDGVLDALAFALSRWPDASVKAVLPARVAALARAFPVLRRVHAIEEAADREASRSRASLDATTARRDAVTALAALLDAVARRNPLLVLVDDAQWADNDGRAVLVELLTRELQPGALFLLAMRSTPARGTPADAPKSASPWSTAGVTRETCTLGALDADAARALARRTLALGDEVPGVPPSSELEDTLVRESEGHPFFLLELARHARGRTAPRTKATLRDLVRARVDSLGSEPRALLDAVALASGPVPQRVAFAAATPGRADPRWLTALRAAGLLRSSGMGRDAIVEPAHDRVREEALAALAPSARRALHERIADALEKLDDVPPARIATHYYGAERPDRAARYAIAAAREAERALAFDRAARWYRTVLLSTKHSPEERAELRASLAQALCDAGRNGDAAEQFLSAAQDAPPEQAHALRRRAASAFMLQGEHQRGLSVMGTVLRDLGETVPSSGAKAALHAALAFARTRPAVAHALRSNDRDERSDAASRPRSPLASGDGADLEAKLDAYQAAGIGTSMADSLLSTVFMLHSVRLSLESANRRYRARGLLSWAALLAASGSRGRVEALRVLAHTEHRIAQHQLSGLESMLQYTWGLWHYSAGAYESSRVELERVCEELRGAPSGERWGLDAAETLYSESLLRLGRLREWRAYSSELDDDPRSAHEHIARGTALLRRAAGTRLLQLDLFALTSHALTILYEGAGVDANAALDRALRTVARTGLLQFELLRIDSLFDRGRCAVAAALELERRDPGAHEAQLRRARHCAERLRREGAQHATGYAKLLEACVLRAQGARTQLVHTAFTDAAEVLFAIGLGSHARAAVVRAYEARGAHGESALRHQRDEAERALREQGVKNASRWVFLHAPAHADAR